MGWRGWQEADSPGRMDYIKKFSLWLEINKKSLKSCNQRNVVIILKVFKRSPWLPCG